MARLSVGICPPSASTGRIGACRQRRRWVGSAGRAHVYERLPTTDAMRRLGTKTTPAMIIFGISVKTAQSTEDTA
eukprot:3801788-Alexandrium_andersonii.AAC.1